MLGVKKKACPERGNILIFFWGGGVNIVFGPQNPASELTKESVEKGGLQYLCEEGYGSVDRYQFVVILFPTIFSTVPFRHRKNNISDYLKTSFWLRFLKLSYMSHIRLDFYLMSCFLVFKRYLPLPPTLFPPFPLFNWKSRVSQVFCIAIVGKCASCLYYHNVTGCSYLENVLSGPFGKEKKIVGYLLVLPAPI